MGTFTTNLNLYEPSVGETGWGTAVNANFSTLDNALVNPAPSVTGTLTAAGLVDLSGVGAGQVKFPVTQNPSANANTLDDYAEGTWTPGLSFNNGATGITYVLQVGRYTKVGRLVTVEFRISLTSKGSSTGAARISGLPFTINSTVNLQGGGALWWNAMTSTLVNLTTFCETGTTRLLIYGLTAAATGLTAMADTNFGNASEISGTFTYTV